MNDESTTPDAEPSTDRSTLRTASTERPERTGRSPDRGGTDPATAPSGPVPERVPCPRCGVAMVATPLAGPAASHYCRVCDRSFTAADL